MKCMVPQALLRGHSKKLCGIDPYFHLDMLVLESMMGDQGAGLLKKRFMDVLKESEAAPDQLCARISRLLTPEVLKWTRAAVKNELMCAQDMAQRMVADEVVLRGDGQSTPWLTSVVKALENYISFPPSGSGGGAASASSTDATVRGHTALVRRFDDVSKKKERTMEMLLPFSVWRHLLSAEQDTKVSQWRAELLKAGSAPPAATHKPESKKAPKKSRKSVASADDVDAAALALLGLRAA